MWRYVSDTQTIGGVPARDLTDAEFSKLESWLAAIVRNSGIYRYEDAAEAVPAPVEVVHDYSAVSTDTALDGVVSVTVASSAPARKPLARKTK